jgi:hypothetical protein
MIRSLWGFDQVSRDFEELGERPRLLNGKTLDGSLLLLAETTRPTVLRHHDRRPLQAQRLRSGTPKMPGEPMRVQPSRAKH